MQDELNNMGGVELDDNPGYNCYNIPSLEDIINFGLPTSSNSNNYYITAESYRDERYGDPDGFKILTPGTAAGDMGFVEVVNPIANYKEGDIIPKALLNTLKIIQHRNTILNDSAVNLPIPYASSEMTEMQHLNRLMSDITTKHESLTKYTQFYYPAASMCYAYEPETKAGETLSPKFKAHNWALPCAGDIARFLWCIHPVGQSEAEEVIFAQAIADNVISVTHDIYMTSTERSAIYFYHGTIGVTSNTAYIDVLLKYQEQSVLPIVSF